MDPQTGSLRLGVSVFAALPCPALPHCRVQHVFARSPPMSTYLLAFVAGQLMGDAIECFDTDPSDTRKKIDIGVWATPEK